MTQEKCVIHFRDINQKINVWVGVFRKSLAERKSGWSDDDYIKRAQELYFKDKKKKFSLIDEWKLVHKEARYMVGPDAYGSSGSKRKSSEGDNSSSFMPTLIRPEGRDEKKIIHLLKSRSKLNIQVEFEKIAADREELKETKEKHMQIMMQEVASA
ncbi:hypothetical protein LIER_29130 [Lithospermum erythrorhizon]|uniref:Uncharacterized protein n=1 Tax=Lithospermum erythrorhizon TaxID=34254 RepID=A0AAV3RN79_LITER